MKQAIKKLYKILPFKRQLFSVLRLFKPPEKIYRHLWFKGVIRVKVEDHSFKIFHHGYSLENELFWKGIRGWDAHALEKWIQLSKTSKFIFDVGANTGIFSLVSGAVNSSASIFAFEPVARVHAKLKKNAELNAFNIKPLRIAASNKNGQTIIYDSADEHNLSASLNPNHRPGSLESIVQSQTLDSFVEENQLKVDLVKIDVERYEPEVIEGFLDSIKKYHPTILIEILDKEIGEKVDRLLKDLPYQYYSIDEEKGFARVEKITKSDGFNYLICTERIASQIGL